MDPSSAAGWRYASGRAASPPAADYGSCCDRGNSASGPVGHCRWPVHQRHL